MPKPQQLNLVATDPQGQGIRREREEARPQERAVAWEKRTSVLEAPLGGAVIDLDLEEKEQRVNEGDLTAVVFQRGAPHWPGRAPR